VEVLRVESPVEDDAEVDAAAPVLEERIWRFQCKRQKTVTPKVMTDIVKETVPDATDSPYGLIIAVACDVLPRRASRS